MNTLHSMRPGKRTGTRSLLAALGLVAALSGCGYTSPFMRPPAAPAALRASQSEALVVFVRPSEYASGVGCTILDEEGHFIGQSPAHTHFAVSMRPGPHMFVSWAENIDALQAELAPGKTYFVEVAPTIGVFSARVHLRALKPGSEKWSKQQEWLRDTQQLQSDRSAGDSYYQRERPKDVVAKVRTAQEKMAKYQGSDLELRTLRPMDGV